MRIIVALLFMLTAAAPAELPTAQPPKAWGPWARMPEDAEQALGSGRLELLQPHPDDDSKESEGVSPKLELSIKRKEGWGYPLANRAGFKMTFYWLAWEAEYANEPYAVDIYTRHGFLIGRYPSTFVYELKLEGSGILRDGRAINYDGRCRYGIGICFQTLDPSEHPLGKGGQGRALEPFRSVAVDPRFVPMGTPLFLPELTGLVLPDGSRHDGCVRADDTGGNIRRRELDFFVESYANYKFLDDQFWGNSHVTPFVEEPRCAYLRHFDPVVDRRSEESDWTKLEASRPRPRVAKLPKAKRPSRPSRKSSPTAAAPKQTPTKSSHSIG